MPAAAHSHAELVAHCVLNGAHNLIGRADEANVVGLAGESLVEAPPEQFGIAQVMRPDLVGRGALALG